jgi:putative tryptophan/tyrosine transport system substrate-binding protein
MSRRHFLIAATALTANAISSGAIAQVQQPPLKPFRIYGILWRGKTRVETGFEDYFGKRGIPIELIWRDAEQKPARLEEFVREIQSIQPDLVYTWGTPPTLAVAGTHNAPAKSSHANIPHLFVAVADPVGTKIVSALKNHGRNITGVYHVAPLATQIDNMRTYRPFTTLGMLYNAAEPNSVVTASRMKQLAATQRFTLVERNFERNTDGKATPEGIAEKIFALKEAGAQWLYLGPDSFLFSQIGAVAKAALDARLPTFSATEAILDSTAPVLTGLVSSFNTIGQFAGLKAEQILVQRMRARDIAIETLPRYSFIVRMDVAKQLDFLPPVSLFNYAIIR